LPVLATVAAAAAMGGLAPALVRWQIQRQVAVYWPGEVTIDHVALHGVAPIELLGVTVRDGAGTTLAVFPSITVAVQELGWTGPVAARLAIRGLTLEAGTPERPITLPVTLGGAVATPHRGALHLDEWRIHYRDVPIAQEIATYLESSDSGLAIDGPVGRLLGSSFAIKLGPLHGPIASWAAGGTVSVETIPLTAIGPLLPADEQLSHGTATVALAFHRGADHGWLGDGRLHVVEADLRGVSLTRKLSHFLGIEELAPLASAEAEIAFELAGTVATVTRGRMASGLPEMAIEPGSRIDLATGRIDASVVLAAGARLGELPLLHPVGTLVKSLTRVRIHGHWRDPEEALFSRG
jgi:hypothetical protein